MEIQMVKQPGGLFVPAFDTDVERLEKMTKDTSVATQLGRVNGKLVLFYRLTPFNSKDKGAA